MTKVSILVPCFNVEKYLRQCLDSVLSQDFSSYEVICVDDGSTDDTANILSAYAHNFSNCLKVIRHPANLGLGPARNTGIDSSAGEFIASVDSDDYIEKNMVSRLYKAAMSNKTDIQNIGYQEVDDSGEGHDRYHYTDRLVVNSPKVNPLNLCWPSFCNKLFRAEFLKTSGIRFPDRRHSFEDLATIPRWVSRATRIGFTSGTPYKYRQRRDSMVKQASADRIGDYLLAFDTLRKHFLPQIHSSANFRQKFMNLVHEHLTWHLQITQCGDLADTFYSSLVKGVGEAYVKSMVTAYGHTEPQRANDSP